jgi:ABC-2 type transport system ATP-binding protein
MNELPQYFPQNEYIIKTVGLTKLFKSDEGVKNLDLQIPTGAIFGFIGPSGCGKTTTVRLLLGIYRPTTGEAFVFGHYPQNFSQLDRQRIGYMPQLFMLQPDLTVWQNLSFAASLYGLSLRRRNRLEKILELVELNGQERKLARDLSGGMQRRLSLAAALIHEPVLLFLDEPTTGIDPVLRRKFWDYFHQLKKEDRTLFITTQYVGEAAYCDYVGVMSNGQLLMVETPQNLKRNGMGGEVIEIRCEGFLSSRLLEELGKLPYVTNRQVRTMDDFALQIVVDDAATALPKLLNWCEANGVQVSEAHQVDPSYDDIFVQIIEEQGSDA